MRRLFLPLALMAALFATPGRADEAMAPPAAAEETKPADTQEAPDEGPHPVLPDALPWAIPADQPDRQQAWMLGSEQAAGPYTLRVRLAENAREGVHTHPDDRIVTVLSGTLSVGFGSIFDETRLRAVPAGAVYLCPADQPHYLWAREGDVEFQESGVGPSGTHTGHP